MRGLKKCFVDYLAYYEEHLTDKTVFYPGAEAALDRLRAPAGAWRS